ncbi:MAG: helix-turn-helix transcriptional regulator [Thermoplasmata archaeon]
MIFKKKNKNIDIRKDEFYYILLNIIFGSIISLSAIVLIVVLLLLIPIIYRINALSIFYFKSFTDYLIVSGLITSISVIILSFIYLNKNIKKLSLELSKAKDIKDVSQSNDLYNPDQEILKYLDEGEKRVYLLLIESGGSLLQKDLVGLDDFSRATISRIIDKLEKKGIIEKIRHGSTNKIILKRFSR